MIRCRMGAFCKTAVGFQPGWATDRGMCLPCETTCLESLRRLPEDYQRIQERLEPGGGGLGSAIRSNAVEAPLPLNVYADYQMRQIHWVICEWVSVVRARRSYHPVDIRALLMGEAVSWGVRVLDVNYSVLVALQPTANLDYATGEKVFSDGVDAAMQLNSIHHRALSFLGEKDVWEERKLPCPVCGKYELGTWVGSEKIECSCGWSCSMIEYSQYVLTMVPPERRP